MINKLETENKTDLFSVRKVLSEIENTEEYDATICVVAFAKKDITKICIESILRNTLDIKYRLLLVFNGLEENKDILDYFNSLDIENKIVVHVELCSDAPFAYKAIQKYIVGKYFIHLPNDCIVTPNWLNNLIKIAESDKKIGMINPVSSNVSNFQMVNLPFSDYEQMQKAAEEFNVSNPRKWQERLRLITLGTLLTAECLMAVGPVFDGGFKHNFSDDDLSFRVRRAGYKIILAGDTWIHHNHDLSGYNNIDYANKLEIGRNNFKEKYYGIDAWDDVNNFAMHFIPYVKDTDNDLPKILGIDTKCGTPILDIKNRMREFDKFECECYAFTEQARYFIDLQTICGTNNVFSGNIDSFQNNFKENYFDYIIIDKPMNCYANPYHVIKSAYRLLNENGHLFFVFKNAFDILNVYYSLGLINNLPISSITANITIDSFFTELENQNYKVELIQTLPHSPDIASQENINLLVRLIEAAGNNNIQETATRLITDKYVLEIKK